MNEHRKEISLLEFRSIQEIPFGKKRSFDALRRLKENLSHLPKEAVQKFLQENDLVFREDGILLPREDHENLPEF